MLQWGEGNKGRVVRWERWVGGGWVVGGWGQAHDFGHPVCHTAMHCPPGAAARITYFLLKLEADCNTQHKQRAAPRCTGPPGAAPPPCCPACRGAGPGRRAPCRGGGWGGGAAQRESDRGRGGCQAGGCNQSMLSMRREHEACNLLLQQLLQLLQTPYRLTRPVPAAPAAPRCCCRPPAGAVRRWPAGWLPGAQTAVPGAPPCCC